MTTYTNATLVWRSNSTTENYNWIKRISDGLTAVGLALTADTGQINLAGTTVAFGAGTPDETFRTSGYQIRKLTASGLPDIFFKFEYGVRRSASFPSSTTANTPSMRVTVGTVTDGAGNLSGVMQCPLYSNFGYSKDGYVAPTTQRPFYISSDGQNYLTMLIDPAMVGGASSASAYCAFAMCVDRSVEPTTGAYDGDGLVAYQFNAEPFSGELLGAYKHQVYNFGAGACYYDNVIPTQATNLFSTSSSGTSTTLFPVSVMLPKVKGPAKSMLYCFKLDVAPGYVFSTTMYGATRSYISGGNRHYPSTPYMDYFNPAFRYD